MSTQRYPLIGGKVARGTRLDACGVPQWGDASQIVSDGIVTIAVTANYDDGQEVTVINIAGKRCINRAAEPELTNLSLDVTFCLVDPDFYTLVTGFPAVYDPVTGETKGFRVNRGIRPSDVNWALEVWSFAQADVGCAGDDVVPYGYLLWPFLTGGRVSDYTIEGNSAVTFTISGAVTKDGSGWDVGPYLVDYDAASAPTELDAVVDPLDHQITFKTLLPPPEASEGLIPLDDPTQSIATGATAGTPGFFTPAGNVRPADFADLVAATLTKSPSTAWTTGQRVILGDGSLAHWSGSAWVVGAA